MNASYSQRAVTMPVKDIIQNPVLRDHRVRRYNTPTVKILFVETVSEMGGAQQSLYEICATLPSLGVEVAAAVPPGPLYDALRSAGVNVYAITQIRARRRGLGLAATLFKLACSPWRIRQILRDVKPDIIHANSVASALAVGRVPKKTLFLSHIRDVRHPAIAVRIVAKRCKSIIAISTAVETYLRNITPARLYWDIRLVRNGIDIARFSPGDKATARKRFAFLEDVPVIGMVAHLIPWKGHDLFLAAAAKIRATFPSAQVVVVGRDLFGEHTAWVKRLRDQISQQAVHWIQDLNETEKILPAFDVLVHPAKDEPFGRVVCEAMAMRIPVVAVRSGGIPDIIRDGINGYLVPQDDADAIAGRVCELLGNPDHARVLAYAARKRIVRKFTTEKLVKKLVSTYHSEIFFNWFVQKFC